MVGKTGGPAYPIRGHQVDVSGAICGEHVIHSGMTLRDYFAGQALAGLLADGVLEYKHITDRNNMAADCYKISDAMLAARADHESAGGEGE